MGLVKTKRLQSSAKYSARSKANRLSGVKMEKIIVALGATWRPEEQRR